MKIYEIILNSKKLKNSTLEKTAKQVADKANKRAEQLTSKKTINKQINPNNDYLYSNKDYYNGFKYGAKKKKKRRLVQGATSSLGAIILLLIFADNDIN